MNEPNRGSKRDKEKICEEYGGIPFQPPRIHHFFDSFPDERVHPVADDFAAMRAFLGNVLEPRSAPVAWDCFLPRHP
jgi:hypothetical protein